MKLKWSRTIALALGTLIGIYSEQCGRDNRPEAKSPEPVFVAIVKVKQQDTYDFKGVEFFEIQGAKGSALVSVDHDLELARALRSVDGERVRLVIERAELERLER